MKSWDLRIATQQHNTSNIVDVILIFIFLIHKAIEIKRELGNY